MTARPTPKRRAGDAAPPERARVLIVDDDERNLLALGTVIDEVADVVVAASGEEALRHLLKGEFAVILLDVFMPGIDGYETAQLIRQREQSRSTPIIFLSAVNKEDSHLLRGYAMGAVDYVFKPVEPVVLRSKVAVFVDLYEKTREIQRKALQEQRLLDENLRIQGEQLSALETLRRMEQRQALIVAALPIVLYLEPVQDRPRVPQFVGGNFEALTGYPFDVLEAQPDLWAERIHEDDRARVLAAYQERARTGSMTIEYRWLCADGRYKYFAEHGVLLRGADGAPAEFAGSLLDVTERRMLETQLVHAQKLDSIGKLTGGIAHDFNNLLAAVLAALGLIERRCALDEQGRNILEMARHAAEQGSELVRRLLAFARRQQLMPAAVPIDRLAATMKALMEHTLGGLVELVWDTAPDTWPVLADQSQLELALMNLVINARDAMPGGGTITIHAENVAVARGEQAELAEGDYVLFSVTDTGTGIASELVDQIFEPFFTTKDVGKGTGLGLSMVYGFAQQSGGSVTVDSTIGEGTCMRLYLPRAALQDVASVPDAIAAKTDARSGPLHILLVDDHPQVRATTAALIEELGHKVTTATRANEGIAFLKDNGGSIDLLVTDYAMPMLSGAEMIHLAREVHPGLPAIIITGYADIEAIANRPADVVVLGKPFRPEQLAAALDEAVRAEPSDTCPSARQVSA